MGCSISETPLSLKTSLASQLIVSPGVVSGTDPTMFTKRSGGGAASEADKIRSGPGGGPGAAKKREFVWPPQLPPPARKNRRVLPASKVFLEYERQKQEQKPKERVDQDGNPLIKLVLKSKPDATANVNLVGGGGKEGGLALQVFSKSIRLFLSVATMDKCPFFEKMRNKKWKGKTEVELELMSPDIVDAFESVLHVLQIPDYSIHEDINLSNQFKIYNAANFLGLRSIQEQCEGFIKQNMDEQVFLSAVEEAKVLKDVNLLDTCYTYFKRVGLKPLLMKKGTARTLDRKKSSSDIVGTPKFNKKEAGIVDDQTSSTSSELTYSQRTRELVHGKKRVKIDSFKKILQQEINRKEKFYTVGSFTSEYDDLVEDVDDDEEGYDNMLQCYMLREKVEDSETGKSMQYFSVYREEDDSFVIAARLVEGTGLHYFDLDLLVTVVHWSLIRLPVAVCR